MSNGQYGVINSLVGTNLIYAIKYTFSGDPGQSRTGAKPCSGGKCSIH